MEKILASHKKKTIQLQELQEKINDKDYLNSVNVIMELIELKRLIPIKAGGTNGRKPELWQKYRIQEPTIPLEDLSVLRETINRLHPRIMSNGYLYDNPKVYAENKGYIDLLSQYFFENPLLTCGMSKKERSYEIFGEEKFLDQPSAINLLKRINVMEKDLLFYETHEPLLDYIPQIKEHMNLLICENKDIWFTIRKLLYEKREVFLFQKQIHGVIYGEGNKISGCDKKEGIHKLENYCAYLEKEDVNFLYWGDLDREGFHIFNRVVRNNTSCNIALFVDAYKVMIDLYKEKYQQRDRSHGEIEEYVDIFSLFEGKYKDKIMSMIKKGYRIPQEIVNYRILVEGMEY